MKRPPVVILSILLFGVFAVLGLISAVELQPIGLGKFMTALTLPVLFAVACLGVLFRKTWARFFGSAIILINALIMIVAAIALVTKYGAEITSVEVVFIPIIFILELLWAYRLGLGKTSKEYFKVG